MMIGAKPTQWFLHSLATILLVTLILPPRTLSQEEVASAFRRYRDREVSTGFYEHYEVKPRRMTPLIEVPGVTRGIFPYSPTAAKVRTRTRLADSHAGIKFYDRRRCEECHIEQTKDFHTVRANLTCRQCHGVEPIASLSHYYSPFNPVRKHAYVCAKCHQGANASYASYIIHSPNPALASTRETFPVLFYVFWFMVALTASTFVIFLPHTILWAIRELFSNKEKTEGENKK